MSEPPDEPTNKDANDEAMDTSEASDRPATTSDAESLRENNDIIPSVTQAGIPSNNDVLKDSDVVSPTNELETHGSSVTVSEFSVPVDHLNVSNSVFSTISSEPTTSQSMLESIPQASAISPPISLTSNKTEGSKFVVPDIVLETSETMPLSPVPEVGQNDGYDFWNVLAETFPENAIDLLYRILSIQLSALLPTNPRPQSYQTLDPVFSNLAPRPSILEQPSAMRQPRVSFNPRPSIIHIPRMGRAKNAAALALLKSAASSSIPLIAPPRSLDVDIETPGPSRQVRPRGLPLARRRPQPEESLEPQQKRRRSMEAGRNELSTRRLETAELSEDYEEGSVHSDTRPPPDPRTAIEYLEEVKRAFPTEVYTEFLEIVKLFKAENKPRIENIRDICQLFIADPSFIVGFNAFLPEGFDIIIEKGVISIRDPTGREEYVKCRPKQPPAPSLPVAKPSRPITKPPPSPVVAPPPEEPENSYAEPGIISDNPSVFLDDVKKYLGPDMYEMFVFIMKNHSPYVHKNVESCKKTFIGACFLWKWHKGLTTRFSTFFPNIYKWCMYMLENHHQHRAEINDATSHIGNLMDKNLRRLYEADPDRDEDDQPPDDLMDVPSSDEEEREKRRQAGPYPTEGIKKLMSIINPKVKIIRLPANPPKGLPKELPLYMQFHDSMSKFINNKEIFLNFMQCLHMFNEGMVDREQLWTMVKPFFRGDPKMKAYFKRLLGFRIEKIRSEPPHHLNAIVGTKDNNVPNEIDYTALKSCGRSYRLLPRKHRTARCSGRTALCREVLNDNWAIFPRWNSEERTKPTHKKSKLEQFMLRTEDERFEIDMMMQVNAEAIAAVEKIRKFSSTIANYKVPFSLECGSRTFVVRAVRRVFGQNYKRVLRALRRNPCVVATTVLNRLKLKQKEWKNTKDAFNLIWEDQAKKHYKQTTKHQIRSVKRRDKKIYTGTIILDQVYQKYRKYRASNATKQGILVSGRHDNVYLSFAMDWRVAQDVNELILKQLKRRRRIPKEERVRIWRFVNNIIPMIFDFPTSSPASTTLNLKSFLDPNLAEHRQPAKQPRRFYCTDVFVHFIYLYQITVSRMQTLFIHAKQKIAEEERAYEMLKLRKMAYKKTRASLPDACDNQWDHITGWESIQPAKRKCLDRYLTYYSDLTSCIERTMGRSTFKEATKGLFETEAYPLLYIKKFIEGMVRLIQKMVQDEQMLEVMSEYWAYNYLTDEMDWQNLSQQYADAANQALRGQNLYCVQVFDQEEKVVGVKLLKYVKPTRAPRTRFARRVRKAKKKGKKNENATEPKAKRKRRKNPIFLLRNLKKGMARVGRLAVIDSSDEEFFDVQKEKKDVRQQQSEQESDMEDPYTGQPIFEIFNEWAESQGLETSKSKAKNFNNFSVKVVEGRNKIVLNNEEESDSDGNEDEEVSDISFGSQESDESLTEGETEDLIEDEDSTDEEEVNSAEGEDSGTEEEESDEEMLEEDESEETSIQQELSKVMPRKVTTITAQQKKIILKYPNAQGYEPESGSSEAAEFSPLAETDSKEASPPSDEDTSSIEQENDKSPEEGSSEKEPQGSSEGSKTPSSAGYEKGGPSKESFTPSNLYRKPSDITSEEEKASNQGKPSSMERENVDEAKADGGESSKPEKAAPLSLPKKTLHSTSVPEEPTTVYICPGPRNIRRRPKKTARAPSEDEFLYDNPEENSGSPRPPYEDDELIAAIREERLIHGRSISPRKALAGKAIPLSSSNSSDGDDEAEDSQDDEDDASEEADDGEGAGAPSSKINMTVIGKDGQEYLVRIDPAVLDQMESSASSDTDEGAESVSSEASSIEKLPEYGIAEAIIEKYTTGGIQAETFANYLNSRAAIEKKYEEKMKLAEQTRPRKVSINKEVKVTEIETLASESEVENSAANSEDDSGEQEDEVAPTKETLTTAEKLKIIHEIEEEEDPARSHKSSAPDQPHEALDKTSRGNNEKRYSDAKEIPPHKEPLPSDKERVHKGNGAENAGEVIGKSLEAGLEATSIAGPSNAAGNIKVSIPSDETLPSEVEKPLTSEPSPSTSKKSKSKTPKKSATPVNRRTSEKREAFNKPPTPVSSPEESPVEGAVSSRECRRRINKYSRNQTYKVLRREFRRASPMSDTDHDYDDPEITFLADQHLAGTVEDRIWWAEKLKPKRGYYSTKVAADRNKREKPIKGKVQPNDFAGPSSQGTRGGARRGRGTGRGRGRGGRGRGSRGRSVGSPGAASRLKSSSMEAEKPEPEEASASEPIEREEDVMLPAPPQGYSSDEEEVETARADGPHDDEYPPGLDDEESIELVDNDDNEDEIARGDDDNDGSNEPEVRLLNFDDSDIDEGEDDSDGVSPELNEPGFVDFEDDERTESASQVRSHSKRSSSSGSKVDVEGSEVSRKGSRETQSASDNEGDADEPLSGDETAGSEDTDSDIDPGEKDEFHQEHRENADTSLVNPHSPRRGTSSSSQSSSTKSFPSQAAPTSNIKPTKSSSSSLRSQPNIAGPRLEEGRINSRISGDDESEDDASARSNRSVAKADVAITEPSDKVEEEDDENNEENEEDEEMDDEEDEEAEEEATEVPNPPKIRPKVGFYMTPIMAEDCQSNICPDMVVYENIMAPGVMYRIGSNYDAKTKTEYRGIKRAKFSKWLENRLAAEETKENELPGASSKAGSEGALQSVLLPVTEEPQSFLECSETMLETDSVQRFNSFIQSAANVPGVSALNDKSEPSSSDLMESETAPDVPQNPSVGSEATDVLVVNKKPQVERDESSLEEKMEESDM